MVHKNPKAWGSLGRLGARDKGPGVNFPAVWTFRQCGTSGQVRRAGWRAPLGSLDQEAMQPEIGPERPWRGAGSPREWRAHGDVEGTGSQAESTVQRV